MITDCFAINFRHDKPTKSAQKMLGLSDELSNASMILADLNMSHEVAPQTFAVDVLERTPFHVQQNDKKKFGS